MDIIFYTENEKISNNCIDFFQQIYTSKDNSQEEVYEFFNQLIKDLKEYHEGKEERKMQNTLRLL